MELIWVHPQRLIIGKKDILILGNGPTQGLEHTLSAERMYSIIFTGHNNKFCLSLHYNGPNIYLFVNGTEIHQFKAKDSEISHDWSVDNVKTIRLSGYVYDYSVDLDAIAIDDILLDIH